MIITMNTQIIKIDENQMDPEAVRKAGKILQQGGIVAFPTETVYGLGGDALNPDSSRKIYAAKGRPSDNPLIVHICRMEDLHKIVSRIPESARKLAKAFWPGPLTMIFPKSEAVPYETTGGLDTVAVRFPSHRTAQAVIDAAGGYIAAPSANTSGRPSPTLARYVVEDMDGRIDMVIDGGDIPIGVESTIVDCTVEPPMLLRPGYITAEMLGEVLGEVSQDQTMMHGDTRERPKAPGMKYRHYAPKGDVTIYTGELERVVERICELADAQCTAGKKVGIIATDESVKTYKNRVSKASIKSAGTRNNEETIARHLYQILREFDDEEVEVIYSEAFDESGIGQAIMNRLLKAAGHHVEQA